MKKLVLFIVCFLIAVASYAQPKRPAYQKMTEDIQWLFNAGQYDSIFARYTPEMKEVMPIDSTRRFFALLSENCGTFDEIEFIRFVDEKKEVALYRADFEKETMYMVIGVMLKTKLAGLYFRPYEQPKINPEKRKRNTIALSFPLDGQWYTFWGGDTPEENYHTVSEPQSGAFDWVRVGDDGKTYRTDGRSGMDYYCFGELVYAPCAGTVVAMENDIPDNIPGRTNPSQPLGNMVMLKISENEYLVLCHFVKGSVQVDSSAKVKKGQLLALCGNSGNSTEPHLHMHIQDEAKGAKARGVKSFFSDVVVNGEERAFYSPVRGDMVSADETTGFNLRRIVLRK